VLLLPKIFGKPSMVISCPQFSVVFVTTSRTRPSTSR